MSTAQPLTRFIFFRYLIGIFFILPMLGALVLPAMSVYWFYNGQRAEGFEKIINLGGGGLSSSYQIDFDFQGKHYSLGEQGGFMSMVPFSINKGNPNIAIYFDPKDPISGYTLDSNLGKPNIFTFLLDHVISFVSSLLIAILSAVISYIFIIKLKPKSNVN